MPLYKTDGTVANKGEWREEIAKAGGVVGYEIIALGGGDLEVFARFSGVSHGEKDGKQLVYELGVTGDPKNAKHSKYHGNHTLYPDAATCLAGFNAKKIEIGDAAKALPIGDGD